MSNVKRTLDTNYYLVTLLVMSLISRVPKTMTMTKKGNQEGLYQRKVHEAMKKRNKWYVPS